jgi:hypothetical protein
MMLFWSGSHPMTSISVPVKEYVILIFAREGATCHVVVGWYFEKVDVARGRGISVG